VGVKNVVACVFAEQALHAGDAVGKKAMTLRGPDKNRECWENAPRKVMPAVGETVEKVPLTN